MSYVHPGLTYFLSNYGPLFNLCDNWISAGDRLPDRRPETWIARRKSCSLAGSKAWPQRLDPPGPSNGPYRVTPHLTSPWQRPGHPGMTFDRSLYSASDSVVRSDLLRTGHSYLRRSTPSWPSPSPRSVLISCPTSFSVQKPLSARTQSLTWVSLLSCHPWNSCNPPYGRWYQNPVLSSWSHTPSFWLANPCPQPSIAFTPNVSLNKLKQMLEIFNLLMMMTNSCLFLLFILLTFRRCSNPIGDISFL